MLQLYWMRTMKPINTDSFRLLKSCPFFGGVDSKEEIIYILYSRSLKKCPLFRGVRLRGFTLFVFRYRR